MTNYLTNICKNKQNLMDFISGLYLQCEGWRKLKSWVVEMNVLCIADQDHQWLVIAVGTPVSLKSFRR